MRAGTVRRRAVSVIAMVTALLVGGLGLAPDAGSRPAFAPADRATIRPGVQVIVGNGQCTANFVYLRGSDVYLGMAAHCAGAGDETGVNGCARRTRPLGTPVRIQGATRPGTLAYSSWVAMQAAGEQDPRTCLHNDFALIRIDPADHGRVNPTVPHWGGPTGVAPSGAWPTAGYRAYGNSSLRQGLTILSPMWGWGAGDYTADGWLRQAYTIVPGVFGDSGMGLMTADGRAAGVLSYLTLLPSVGMLGFTDVGKAMGYARTHGMAGLQLATGARMDPNQLPLGL